MKINLCGEPILSPSIIVRVNVVDSRCLCSAQSRMRDVSVNEASGVILSALMLVDMVERGLHECKRQGQVHQD